MLTGRLVHEGPTTSSQLTLAATRAPSPVSGIAPGLAHPIARWIDRGLSFDRADRFASAAEMRAALRDAHATATGQCLPEAAPGDLVRRPLARRPGT